MSQVMAEHVGHLQERFTNAEARIKVLEDALSGHAFQDDAQVRSILIDRDDDKSFPRAVVEVRPYTPRTKITMPAIPASVASLFERGAA